MRLDQIAGQLGTFFCLDESPPDNPFRSLVPAVYGEAGIELARYLEPHFPWY